jgi:hypothetical protein
MPTKYPMRTEHTAETQFPNGSKVILRGCRYCQLGTVSRIERREVSAYLIDLDYLARHRSELLVLAEETAN